MDAGSARLRRPKEVQSHPHIHVLRSPDWPKAKSGATAMPHWRHALGADPAVPDYAFG